MCPGETPIAEGDQYGGVVKSCEQFGGRIGCGIKTGETVIEENTEADRNMKKLIQTAKSRFEKKLPRGNGSTSSPFFAYIKQKTKSRLSIGPLQNK